MKNNTTRIAVVLDRSGSMMSIQKATIDGFNEFINQQKQEPGEVTVKLVRFDHEYEEVFDKPLAEVPALTNETFEPRGMTALNDAIGQTIDLIGQELSRTSEANRPGKVVIVILTDGGENSSLKFKRNQVAEMVKHQQEKYNWVFVFLGANQDAVLTAASYNIGAQTAMSYAPNNFAVNATFTATSRLVRSARQGVTGQSLSYTEEERGDSLKK